MSERNADLERVLVLLKARPCRPVETPDHRTLDGPHFILSEPRIGPRWVYRGGPDHRID